MSPTHEQITAKSEPLADIEITDDHLYQEMNVVLLSNLGARKKERCKGQAMDSGSITTLKKNDSMAWYLRAVDIFDAQQWTDDEGFTALEMAEELIKNYEKEDKLAQPKRGLYLDAIIACIGNESLKPGGAFKILKKEGKYKNKYCINENFEEEQAELAEQRSRRKTRSASTSSLVSNSSNAADTSKRTRQQTAAEDTEQGSSGGAENQSSSVNTPEPDTVNKHLQQAADSLRAEGNANPSTSDSLLFDWNKQ